MCEEQLNTSTLSSAPTPNDACERDMDMGDVEIVHCGKDLTWQKEAVVPAYTPHGTKGFLLKVMTK